MPVRVEMNDTRMRQGLALAVQTAGERAAQHLVHEIQDRIDTYGLVIGQAGQDRLFAGKKLHQERLGRYGHDQKPYYHWWPSEPGNPPHLRTGNLHRSITYTSGETAQVVSVHVGTPVDYGAHLERPGKHQRPYLASTLAETVRTLSEIFADTLRAELAGGGSGITAVAAE
jgi:phage gpG-like protein